MATGHLDRLSAIDASFLAQEREGSHMHIGARDGLRGPGAEKAEFTDLHISLMGDYEAMHDLDALGSFIEDEIAVLREAAEAGAVEAPATA